MILTFGYMTHRKTGYIHDTCPMSDTSEDTYLEPYTCVPYLRARLDARWDDALGASLAALGALPLGTSGRCLRCRSSHSSSLASQAP
jgi:hypothetical protein